MIELHHLEKRYDDPLTGQPFYAVKDLSLTFPSGEITALLGPSGCGKTTTLRMINRLIEPTGGQIVIEGQDVMNVKPEALRRKIGYVIQQIGLFPHLTVAQNVATVPDLLGAPKAQTRARVRELLDLVGLEPSQFAAKRPSELSGGQQQRVGVARALAADPPVLLMDEPFGALDPLARDKLQEAFREIQQRLKKTIVMVTHDIDEALKLGDKVALLNAGTLAQFGTPDDLVRRPASDFVKQFLGDDALLRQLAGVRSAALARRGDGAGLPQVSGQLDARSALSVMLRERAEAVAVMGEDGQVSGVLSFHDLEQA
ncbi:amino acid ABC transporter ATP-binding protein [Deinococcus irradiatisoli]|uniref:Amino acid ABC transporter ATP-binding protein n=1 Tax=Deinococcus irradiatisoli TaxID=2202254 RepID=A0A2Z3JJ11_9DEIO|nr:ABC transporter ATP-binding protein [Deinococcus irradiatisoli]AWN21938.1 amino acid ABC transporter ATP-binding protein [Deinococcus irradiatisoli]